MHVISSLKVGGAEKILCSLVDQLQAFFEQQVIYFHEGPVKEELQKLGIGLYQIKPSYGPMFIYRLIQAIKKSKPDIVHSSLWAANFFGVLAARFLKIPIICSLHALREHEGKLRNMLDRLSLPYAQKIIAVSSTIVKSVNNARLLPPEKLCLINNGIDTQNLIKTADNSVISRADLSLDAEQFVIGAVGRFVKEKNLIFCLPF